MTLPRTPADPPMAEPGKRPSGADVGGMRATADGGLADATQRDTERRDENQTGRASVGDASGGAADPRVDLGGTPQPGASGDASGASDRPASETRASAPSAGTPSGGGSRRMAGGTASSDASTAGAAFDDEEGQWRHPPVAPKDAKSPVESLGKAIGDVVTGSVDDARERPRKP